MTLAQIVFKVSGPVSDAMETHSGAALVARER
jgi:hypothetical protein